MGYFFVSFNVHICVVCEDPLLMGVSRARFFVKNVLYYSPMANKKLKKVANDCLVKSLKKRKEKKPHIALSFDSLVSKLQQVIEAFPDNCDNCNTKNHQNGTTTYFHTVVTPVIVKPGNNWVIALAPEFITPQDGHDKQDCENAAAKRWIERNGPWLKKLGVTLTADDLYCKQPICELILEQGLNFVLA